MSELLGGANNGINSREKQRARLRGAPGPARGAVNNGASEGRAVGRTIETTGRVAKRHSVPRRFLLLLPPACLPVHVLPTATAAHKVWNGLTRGPTPPTRGTRCF